MQLNDVAVSLQSGMPLFTVFMQQGAQIADSFGGWGNLFDIIKDKLLGAGDAADESSESLSDSANSLSENAENAGKLTGFLNPVTIGIGALAAAVGVLAYAWFEGANEQERFNESLILTGGAAGVTAGQLSDMSSRVAAASDSTIGASASVLNQLVSSGKVAGESFEVVSEAILNMSDATGVATENLVEEFNKIAADPITAITALNEKYNFLTMATYEQIKALQDEGRHQEAAKLATETYANVVNQRANGIKDNLGYLATAWDSVTGAAKGAWDAMANLGRTLGPMEQISNIKKKISAIDDMKVTGVVSAVGYAYRGEEKARLQQQLTMLESMVGIQEGLAKVGADQRKREKEAIDNQERFNKLVGAGATNAEKRTKAEAELNKLIQKNKNDAAAGVRKLWTSDDIARARAGINEQYKDTKKSGGGSEDAGQRLLDQIRSQTEALQAQLDSSEKLNSVTQQRIKFESQIAELQRRKSEGGKLTKEQQSLLSSSDEIVAAYKAQEAISNQTKTLDDYRKMQSDVRDKEQKTNDLLRERLDLLQKVKATGKISDADIEATRKSVLNNTSPQLPESVTKLTKNMSPTGGELSGSWDGMLQQAKQLQQAMTELDEWNNRALENYRLMYEQKALTTSEYEQKISDTQQRYRQSQEQLDAQRNQIVTRSIY